MTKDIDGLFPDHNLIPMGAFRCDYFSNEEMYLAMPKKRLTEEEFKAKQERIEKLFSCGLDEK